MNVPLSWLRDFARIDVPLDELFAVLSELGLPVEAVTHVGADLTGVVVAKVLEIHAIEGADKIRRVLVDTGTGEPTQVVCGAWNFDVGATVPFATVGTVLQGDFTIGKRKMKGVESAGMICSSDELGLHPSDHSGILVLPDGLPVGADFAEAMGIERDVVLELEVNPNRPDAMSIAEKTIRQSVSLPARVARRVKSLAKTSSTSANRIIVDLIESGIEAREQEKKRFFELADRLVRSSDAEEQKRLKEELARMTFGE